MIPAGPKPPGKQTLLSGRIFQGIRDCLPRAGQGPFLSLMCRIEHPKPVVLTLYCAPLHVRSGILVKLLSCLKAQREDRKPLCLFNLYALTGLIVRKFPGCKPYSQKAGCRDEEAETVHSHSSFS